MLSACLDRDLTFEQEEGLRGHLSQCARCAEQLKELEGIQSLLRNLPVTEPGPQFYPSLCERIRQARGSIPEGSERRGLIERLQGVFAPQWLRPAMGMALALAAGLVIGFYGGGHGGGFETSSSLGAPPIAQVSPSSLEPGPEGSPIADLDLSHLSSLSDSLQLEGEEYLLDPYVRDPQRGLVPAGSGHQRTVGGSRGDDPSDVYITF
jgi:hypothetical protein